MTYGWAILLVILVAAALFVLGIFDVNKIVGNKAVGFTEVGVSAFQLASNGTLSLQLQNQAGKKIDIRNVTAVYSGTTVTTDVNVTNLGVGSSSSSLNIGSFGAQTAGDSYTMTVQVEYRDRNSGFYYSQYGTLNGIVTP